ncbi:hypothetical protein BU16DRAFT_211610 [Lophium mytilinum]|uniref:Uncharacterized protein n=1 Tax=Lophium mytilinum TaxID=390894 RepID=A0A6A6RC03_9PEZI|nr:hypothetical protein BU16DRAFT_211610 [Lophium mytilinum]
MRLRCLLLLTSEQHHGAASRSTSLVRKFIADKQIRYLSLANVAYSSRNLVSTSTHYCSRYFFLSSPATTTSLVTTCLHLLKASRIVSVRDL